MNNKQITQLWADMESSITGMVVNMGQRMSMPVEDLMSRINEDFYKCCKNYDPIKSTTTPQVYIQYQLKLRVLDFHKSLRRKTQIPINPKIDVGSGLLSEKSDTPLMDSMVDYLETTDAARLLKLILSMCEDQVAKRRSASDKMDRAVRIAQDDLKWSESRISSALWEIRQSYHAAVTA
jgi:hypothetical protein